MEIDIILTINKGKSIKASLCGGDITSDFFICRDNSVFTAEEQAEFYEKNEGPFSDFYSITVDELAEKGYSFEIKPIKTMII